jgi:WD40 repeat protein
MKINKKNKKFLTWFVIIVVLFFMGIRCFFSGTSIEYKYWDIISQGISVVALSSDGKLLAGGNNDGRIIIWDTRSRKRIRTFQHNNIAPGFIIFHPSKTWLIVADHRDTVIVWDYNTNEKKVIIRVNSVVGTDIRRVLISPDEKRMIICFRSYGEHLNAYLQEYNFESQKSIMLDFSIHKDILYSADISKDGTKIAVDEYILHSNGHDLIQKIKHGNAINDLFFLPDSKRIVTASSTTSLNPHNIALWDIDTGKKLKGHVQHRGLFINKMAMISGGRFAISAGEDYRVCIWEIETGKVIWSRRVGGMFSWVAVSDDGSKAVVTNWFGPIEINIAAILKRYDCPETLK